MSIHSKDHIEEAENIILMVEGGMGRNIMATAVVRNLKKAYPDKRLIVICGSPDIFLKNPHIYRTYHLANPTYFYDDFFKNSKSVVLDVEPYRHFEYIYKKKHFVEAWCEMLGIECDSVYPEMFFNQSESDLAKAYVDAFDKELVLVQFEGGKVPDSNSKKDRLTARGAMYRRHLIEETQQGIVDALNMLNFKVGVVAHENQYKPGASELIFFPTRAVCLLIPHVAEVICIDSFLMHAAAVHKKESIVCWAGTSPIALGYEGNINIRKNVCDTPECGRPNSYLFDMQSSGFQWDCPVDDRCTRYTVDEVMEVFKKKTGGRCGESRETKPYVIRAGGENPYGIKVEPQGAEPEAQGAVAAS